MKNQYEQKNMMLGMRENSFKNDSGKSIVIFKDILIILFCVFPIFPVALLVKSMMPSTYKPPKVLTTVCDTDITGTITIGGKTWTQKNLNIWTDDSKCYMYDWDYCVQYGRLYSRKDAIGICAALGDDWRLPTMDDWNALIAAVGGNSVAGTKLKTQTGWKNSQNISIGTDEFCFSALPAGYQQYNRYARFHTSRFMDIGKCTRWWGIGIDFYVELCYNKEEISMQKHNIHQDLNMDLHSVRCVKNSIPPPIGDNKMEEFKIELEQNGTSENLQNRMDRYLNTLNTITREDISPNIPRLDRLPLNWSGT